MALWLHKLWYTAAWSLSSLHASLLIFPTGILTSIPETPVPGTLSVCPGVSFSLTCVHDNPNPQFAATLWQLPDVSQCIISHSVSGDVSCDPFTVTMIGGTAGPTLSSTVRVTAMDLLNCPSHNYTYILPKTWIDTRDGHPCIDFMKYLP